MICPTCGHRTTGVCYVCLYPTDRPTPRELPGRAYAVEEEDDGGEEALDRMHERNIELLEGHGF